MTRVVLVIGASSGIGRAAAQQLAARGDHLVLASRSRAALEDTAKECSGAASVTVAPVDVTDAAAVDQLVADVVGRHGALDAVISTAGVVAYGRFEDVPADVFDAVLQTNLHGAANVARTVLPVFRRQQAGTLVLFGSVIGNIAAPSMSSYAISKWAVRCLGRQLAIENRDLPRVRISVVSPGGVDTPIYRQAANYQGRGGRPPAPVDSADKVARAAVRALDHPRDRISVGVLNPLMRLGFNLVPAVFDALVGPLYAVVASRPGSEPPTTGNVFAPVAGLEAVSGGENQGMGDLFARLRGA